MLKGNALSDKRLKKLVENERTLSRQVLDYIRQHCSKQSGATGKGKKGKKGKNAKENKEEVWCRSFKVNIIIISLLNIANICNLN